ncbi:hypothetical protein J2772_002842 [Chryseobacterium jejuense]|nr:hypothetical protein [Chryseobacterium jejuense]
MDVYINYIIRALVAIISAAFNFIKDKIFAP